MKQPNPAKKIQGNPDAINDAYTLFVETGYKKTKEDFVNLISTNEEALNDAYKLFTETGYNKDINEFSNLLGVKKKEQSLPSNGTSTVPNQNSGSAPTDGSSATVPRPSEQDFQQWNQSFDAKKQSVPKNPLQQPDISKNEFRDFDGTIKKLSPQPAVNQNLEVAKNAYAYATANASMELSKQRLKDEVDNDQTLDYLREGAKKIIGGIINPFARVFMGKEANEQKKEIFNTKPYTPLTLETKQAQEEFVEQGIEATPEMLRKRAEELFIEKDQQDQLHQLIDEALPIGYDREGVWKELKLEQLRSNDKLRSKVASAEVFKSVIEDFKSTEINLLSKIGEGEDLSEEELSQYNALREKAVDAESKLNNLAKNFDSYLKEARNDEEKLELFKYNYNDYEKTASLLWNTTKNIVAGTTKIAAETIDFATQTAAQVKIPGIEDLSEMASDEINKNEAQNEQFYRYKASSINSWSDLGSYASQLFAEQVPVLTSIYLGGNLGTAAVSLGSGGQKINELEEGAKQPFGRVYSDGEKLTAGLLYAGAEFIPEKFGTARILKDLSRTVNSASDVSRRLFQEGFRKTALKAVPKAVKSVARTAGLEGGTELITAESQIKIDKDLLGIVKTDSENNEQRFESFFAGAFMGGAMGVAGGALGFAVAQSKLYSDSKDVVKAKEIFDAINKNTNEIETNTSLTEAEVTQLYKENNELSNQAFAIVEKNAAKGAKFSLQEKSFLLDVNLRQAELRKEGKEVLNSNFSKEIKDAKIKELETEFNSLEKNRKATLEGNYSPLLQLKDEEILRLKEQATQALVSEAEAAGKTEFNFDDKAITNKAIELYEKQQQEAEQKTQPQAEKQEKGNQEVGDAVEARNPMDQLPPPPDDFNIVAEKTKPSEAVEQVEITPEEKASLRENISNNKNALVRTGVFGKDAFFALPNEGVFGEVVDKIGEDPNVSAYIYPEDFRIKNMSNTVFDDYMGKKMYEKAAQEGFDAVYVMEIDGSTVLHVINTSKLIKFDEKLPELRQVENEAAPTNNPSPDGSVPSGIEPVGRVADNEKPAAEVADAEVVQPAIDAKNDSREEELVEIEEEEFDMLLSGEAERRRKDGKYTKEGVVITRQEPSKGPVGNKDTVKFAEGVEVEFEYTLIEANEIQPSHINGRRNEKFFITEAQPKNRKDDASKNASDKIGQNPKLKEVGENPVAYFGAPVVNERGEVIQGNNRAEGLKKHYDSKGKSYKAQLKAEAAKFGFTAEQIEAMNEPVLVRKAKVSDDKAIELGNYDVKDLETGGKRRLDPVTTSRRISKGKKAQLVEALFGNDSEITLNKAIRTNFDKTIAILRSYLNDAQMMSIYNNDGTISQNGIDDLEGLVRYFLFDGGNIDLADQFESIPSHAKEAIYKSLPKILSLPKSKSILAELQNAIAFSHKFIRSEYGNFDLWLTQLDMFDQGNFTELETALARLISKAKNQKELITIFAKYNRLASDFKGDMFEEARPGLEKTEVVKNVFNLKEYQDEKNDRSPKEEAKLAEPSREGNREGNAEGKQEPKPDEEVDNSDLEDDTEIDAQGFVRGNRQNQRDLSLSDTGPVKLRFPFQKYFKRVWSNTFKSNVGLDTTSGEVVRSRNRALAAYSDHINHEAKEFSKMIRAVKRQFPKDINTKLLLMNDYLAGKKGVDVSFLSQEQIEQMNYFRERINGLSNSLIDLLEGNLNKNKNRVLNNAYKAVDAYFNKKYKDNLFSQNDFNDMIMSNKNELSDTEKAFAEDLIDIVINDKGVSLESATNLVNAYIFKNRKTFNAKISNANIESSQNLINTIKDNLNTYITRSYQIFSDDNYRDMITGNFNEINKEGQLRIRGAINYLIREEGLSRDEATKTVASYLADIRRQKSDFSVTSSGSAMAPFFKKRKEVPKEFRELLGESKDPLYNYVNTVYKISQYLANIEYQNNLRNHLIDNQIGTTEPKLGYVKIAGESEGWQILNDIYVPVEFKEAFDDMQPLKSVENRVYKAFIAIAGIVKINKTIFSPTTTSRNLLSGVFLGANSGHFFLMKPEAIANAWNQAWNTNKSQNELQQERKKLIKLGVVGDGSNSGELLAVLNDFSKEVDRMVKKNLLLNVFDVAKTAYAFGDDFYKITGFYIEKQRFIDAGMNEKEAEEKAAYRINNGYPTYSYLPKNIQRLRRLPIIGSFVSFPYESMRTTKNNLVFIKEDFDEGRTKMAFQRIAGMIIANSTLFGLSTFSMALLGLSDDDDDAIRDMLPEYQKNSKLIYTGTKDGKPTFIDGTAFFPNEVYFKPIRTLIEKREGRDLDDKMKESLKELLSPYISKDISFKTILEISENKNEFNQKIYLSDNLLTAIANESEKITNHLMKQAGPGVYNNFSEFMKANEVNPGFFGDKFSSYGKEYTNKEALLGLVGFRLTALNYNVAMSSYAARVKGDTNDDKKSFSKLIKTSKVLNKEDVSVIVDEYKNYYDDSYEKLLNIVNSGKKLGMSNNDIAASLKASKISNADIESLLTNQIPALKPISKQTISAYIEKLELNYKGKDIRELRSNFIKNVELFNRTVSQKNTKPAY